METRTKENFLSSLFHYKGASVVNDTYGNVYELGREGIVHDASRQPSETTPAKISLLIYGLNAMLSKNLKVSFYKEESIYLIETEKQKIVVVQKEDTNSMPEKIEYTAYTNSTLENTDEVIGVLHMVKLLESFDEKGAFMESSHLLKLRHASNRAQFTKSFYENSLRIMDSYYFERKHLLLDEKIEVNYDDAPEVDQFYLTLKGVKQTQIFKNENLPDFEVPTIYQTEEKEVSETDKKNSSLFSDVKSGKYRSYAGLFNDQASIPDISLLEDYVPGNEFFANFRRVKNHLERLDPTKNNRRFLNLAFVGAPGTGKTILTDVLGAAFGLPVYHMACARHTEENDFTWTPTIGDFGVTEEATMTWNAFKNGGIIVLEEANLVDPGVLLGVFSKALENPAEIGDSEKNRTKRSPLCIVVMTMNPGATGTKSSNEAFFNRFQYWTRFQAPTKEDEVKRVMTMLSLDEKETDNVGVLYDIYSDIVRKTLELGGTDSAVNVLSTRSLANAAEDELLMDSDRREAVESALVTPVLTYIEQNYDEDTAQRFQTDVADVVLKAITSKGSYRTMKKKVV